MRKEDADSVCIPGQTRPSFPTFLEMQEDKDKQWVRCRDKFNRPLNKIESPEMAYGELRKLLDFKDTDVTFEANPAEGRPHAWIRTDWLSLDIFFKEGPRKDGADESVRCRALMTEHRLQKFVDAYGERKYRHPSVMEEEDFTGDGGLRYGLVLTLNGWSLIHGPRGQLWKRESPEMTYAELQAQINFNDEDVTPNPSRKDGEPHAWIKTPRWTCEITYVDKVFDGKNKSVRMKAVLIDNEQQKSVEEDKRKGVVDKFEFFRKRKP